MKRRLTAPRPDRTARVTRPGHVAAALGLPLAAALALGACASSGGSGAAANPPAPTSAISPAGANSATGTTIATHDGTDGTYLSDRSGRAIYLWMGDTSDSSSCSGACAAAWPPVTTTAAPHAAGSTQAGDLGTSKRTGGTVQVTYDGHPLYYYAGDTGAGATNGQGANAFGAIWWLVAPSGSALTGAGPTGGPTAPSTVPLQPASGPGNYGY